MTEFKCPTCDKLIQWDQNFPFRPFCCERCKLIDLGAWANEEHRIVGTQNPQPSNDSHS